MCGCVRRLQAYIINSPYNKLNMSVEVFCSRDIPLFVSFVCLPFSLHRKLHIRRSVYYGDRAPVHAAKLYITSIIIIIVLSVLYLSHITLMVSI